MGQTIALLLIVVLRPAPRVGFVRTGLPFLMYKIGREAFADTCPGLWLGSFFAPLDIDTISGFDSDGIPIYSRL